MLARLAPRSRTPCAGRGRLVLLAGEPGIGKTRTRRGARPRARERGREVLMGRCLRGRGRARVLALGAGAARARGRRAGGGSRRRAGTPARRLRACTLDARTRRQRDRPPLLRVRPPAAMPDEPWTGASARPIAPSRSAPTTTARTIWPACSRCSTTAIPTPDGARRCSHAWASRSGRCLIARADARGWPRPPGWRARWGVTTCSPVPPSATAASARWACCPTR